MYIIEEMIIPYGQTFCWTKILPRTFGLSLHLQLFIYITYIKRTFYSSFGYTLPPCRVRWMSMRPCPLRSLVRQFWRGWVGRRERPSEEQTRGEKMKSTYLKVTVVYRYRYSFLHFWGLMKMVLGQHTRHCTRCSLMLYTTVLESMHPCRLMIKFGPIYNKNSIHKIVTLN